MTNDEHTHPESQNIPENNQKTEGNQDVEENIKSSDDTQSEKDISQEIPSPSELPGKSTDAYGVEQISHLSDLEHVRKRPSMYIGDTTVRGLHHLVYEVVDNSIDEAMAGYASLVSVTVNEDGSVTVEDNGRGIPVEIFPELNISTLEGVMTVLKFGGKFGDGAYTTSGGLHGVGVTVVNFLSEWCVCQVYRDGYVWQQEYERGVPTSEVRRVGKSSHTGTKTTFKPDHQIFPEIKFTYSTLYRRLQELAFLNSGVKIVFKDMRTGDGDVFHYKRGLTEFVEYLNRSSKPIHEDVINIHGSLNDVQWDIALQYTEEYTENVYSYVNNINTVEGGTHVSGFRAALTRSMNMYGKKEDLFKKMTPSGDDFREGLTAVLSLRIPHPQFEGQTKTKLGNGEIEGIVTTAVYEALTNYFEENPKNARDIVKKSLLAAEARESARKARLLVRERKGALSSGGMPGKLRDCSSKEVEKCELYLVEGQSAGGTAEGGRLREYQAILPLRGKIINAYKAREDKVLSSDEIRNLISAIGIGIGTEIDLSKRRYNKIVIMTDADVDGSHIRTLLLTFFYRHMYELIREGHVYIAQPPLFRVVYKKHVSYVQTEEEMKTLLLDLGIQDAVFDPMDGRILEGEQMVQLANILSPLEDMLNTLERRGINLKLHAMRQDPVSGKLPVLHAFIGRQEFWFADNNALETFVDQYEKENHCSIKFSDSISETVKQEETFQEFTETNGQFTSEHEETTINEAGEEVPSVRMHVMEIHEVRSINHQLAELRKLGFEIDSLFPKERTGQEGDRYKLHRAGVSYGLEDLRGLLPAIRKSANKLMKVTRFKGLGEMNAEQIRETTLDPERRTMIKVNLDDAGAADDLFRILMGEKVEPRREFIEKYALEVSNLDI